MMLKCFSSFRVVWNVRNLHSLISMRAPMQMKMPALSPTMTDGQIVQWCKNEGEEISAGDVVCEVQTDKAVVSMESDEDGILAKIMVPSNRPGIKIGELIAVMAYPSENWQDIASQFPSTSSAKPDIIAVDIAPGEPKVDSVELSKSPASTAQSKLIGPAVRLLLQSHNLDALQINASGPHGLLLKEDVLAFVNKKSSSDSVKPFVQTDAPTPISSPFVAKSLPTTTDPSIRGSFTDIQLTSMRQTIAKRLSESKSSIPHAYVRGVACLDRITTMRRDVLSRTGLKLSVNDFVIKACAFGLRFVPQLNATCESATGLPVHRSCVDICMAVATPKGLLTPIIHNADQIPISQLSSLAVELAAKARGGKLQPHEFQGGSFTISNLGMFGIREFTAIINAPQVAIIAVGTGISKSTHQDASGNITFSNNMTLTLSIDSRFIDEVTTARFLSYVSSLLSFHPEMLLVGDSHQSAVHGNLHVSPDDFDTVMLELDNTVSSTVSAP